MVNLNPDNIITALASAGEKVLKNTDTPLQNASLNTTLQNASVNATTNATTTTPGIVETLLSGDPLTLFISIAIGIGLIIILWKLTKFIARVAVVAVLLVIVFWILRMVLFG